MRKIQHALERAMYEWAEDDLGRCSSPTGTVGKGRFDRDGRWVSGGAPGRSSFAVGSSAGAKRAGGAASPAVAASRSRRRSPDRRDAAETGYLGKGPSTRTSGRRTASRCLTPCGATSPGYFGRRADIPVDRYLHGSGMSSRRSGSGRGSGGSPAREEVLAEVGDTEVYDICDTSILLVRTAPGRTASRRTSTPACIAVARLRDCRWPGAASCAARSTAIAGPSTESSSGVPARWDFPQVEPGRVRAAGSTGRHVGAALVFVNPIPNANRSRTPG